jgi:hypothetical protein
LLTLWGPDVAGSTVPLMVALGIGGLIAGAIAIPINDAFDCAA